MDVGRRLGLNEKTEAFLGQLLSFFGASFVLGIAGFVVAKQVLSGGPVHPGVAGWVLGMIVFAGHAGRDLLRMYKEPVELGEEL